MSQLAEQATDPGRKGARFQRDPAARHRADLCLRRLKFVREQFFLAAAAQNIKRLVRFLSQGTEPMLATRQLQPHPRSNPLNRSTRDHDNILFRHDFFNTHACFRQLREVHSSGPRPLGFDLFAANDSSFRFCLIRPLDGQMVTSNSCMNTNVSPQTGKLVISF